LTLGGSDLYVGVKKKFPSLSPRKPEYRSWPRLGRIYGWFEPSYLGAGVVVVIRTAHLAKPNRLVPGKHGTDWFLAKLGTEQTRSRLVWLGSGSNRRN
jgi:hypothetical protein